MRFIDWLFSLEEINGGERCPRTCIAGAASPKSFQVYLQPLVVMTVAGPADHPKRFISIGSVGRYIEENPPVSVSIALRGFEPSRNTLHRLR